MKIYFVIGILMLLCGVPLRAEEKMPFPPNAALKYWLAAACLPANADEELRKYYEHPESPESDAFVESCKNSVALFHDGAAIAGCDWGLNESAGPYLRMPHLSRMRLLGRVVLVVAERDFEHKKYDSALDHAFAVLAMARHIAQGGQLIGKLVEVNVNAKTVEMIAMYLRTLPADARDNIERRIAELPPSPAFSDCIRTEQRTYLGWFRQRFSKLDAEKRSELSGLLEGQIKEEDKAGIAELLRDDTAFSRSLDALDRVYTELAGIASQPAGQWQPALGKFEEKLKAANPFIRMVVPSFVHVGETIAAADARVQLLEAAADIASHGVAALEKYKTNFEYAKLKAGFSLTSPRRVKQQKVTLYVGEAAPKPPKETDAVKPPAPPEPGDF